MGLIRTNVMLDRELWQAAIKHGEKDERSGSYVVNQALRKYLNKPKKKPVVDVVPDNWLVAIPLKTGIYYVTEDEAKELGRGLSVNVTQELNAMANWCEANPAKRKTKTGIKRFINSWLARAQQKGGSNMSAGQATMSNLEGF